MEQELLSKIALLAGLINQKKNQDNYYRSLSSRTHFKRSSYYPSRNYQYVKPTLFPNKTLTNTAPTKPKRLKPPFRNLVVSRNKKDTKKIPNQISVKKIQSVKSISMKKSKPSSLFVPTKLTIGGVTFTRTNNKLIRTKSSSSLIRERVKKAKKLAQKTKQKSSKLCLFFTKFGKCRRGEKCIYVHDKTKVAICRNFIKGKCTDAECPLSHEIEAGKMPVCYHFLRGACNNEKCPYSHVRVNPNAAICTDFVDGYCAAGENCKLKHIYPKKQKKGDDKTSDETKQVENKSE